MGALGGCTANAGGSPGEPSTADSVTEGALDSTSGGTTSSQPLESTSAPTSSPSDGSVAAPTSSAEPPLESGTGGEGDTNSDDVESSDVISCDPRKVVCKRAQPSCDYGFVPRIVDGCYGECVRIDDCVCDGADACPEHERYTCNNSRQRCTPYLN